MPETKKKILAISGSLREKSYNTSALHAFKKFAPEDVDIEIFTLNSIPMFSEDLEEKLPKEVQKFITKVADADALIISTPEYNNMIPGVLKNALEWLSRGYSSEHVQHKPLAITGVSTGGFGTVRAQNQLMLLAQILRMKISPDMRLPISHAVDVFDEDGNTISEEIESRITTFVEKFSESI